MRLGRQQPPQDEDFRAFSLGLFHFAIFMDASLPSASRHPL